MTEKLEINYVHDIFYWLESSGKDFNSKTPITQHTNKLGDLCSALTFVNNQMPPEIQQLSTSLIKDYVNSGCQKENYNYDLCERLSRTIMHAIQAEITSISALKEEKKIIKI